MKLLRRLYKKVDRFAPARTARRYYGAVKNRKKVFGIGLSKTGTTSLTGALNVLGIRSDHFPHHLLELEGETLLIRTGEMALFKGYTDTPIARFYRELDEAFPGSRFILTVRDREDWARSCEKHFTPGCSIPRGNAQERRRTLALNRLHLDLYGTAEFDRDRFVAAYDAYVAGVLDYFEGREQDLLVMDICAGEGWDVLCPFLNVPYPDEPFPKRNMASRRRR